MNARQTTIRGAVEVEGVGLFSGMPVKVRLLPAEADRGVTFVRTDLPGAPALKADVELLGPVDRHMMLRSGGVEVHTCEHLLACTTGLGVDNLTVELSAAELPVCDGSAAVFAEAIRRAGVVELDRPRRSFLPARPFSVEEQGARLELSPSPRRGMTVEYVLDYGGPPLGSSRVSFAITPEVFLKEIAPARTFCLEAEARALQARGLGGGATYDNSLIIGPDGPIGNRYRFADEPARHKVLDLLGDLALLGAALVGNLRAVRSGHALNAKLVKELRRQMAENGNSDVKLDIREIMRILPHRYPFLLVDRVIEIQGYERAVGIKNCTMNEHFFQGHFPGRPMMPGVLQIEAMAQLAGVLLLRKLNDEKKLAVLAGIDGVRFRRSVVPGDQLVLEAVAVRVKTRTGQVKCKGTVDGKPVCEALITFVLVDFDESQSNGAAEPGAGAAEQKEGT